MDAHLFRCFCAHCAPLLQGARLTKIQEPLEDILTFSLDLGPQARSTWKKMQLVLRSGRKEPFLFLSASRLAAGASPSAFVMRLRKYAANKSIKNVVVRWLERELWLLMSGVLPEGGDKKEASQQKCVWLVLTLRDGARLEFLPPEQIPLPSEVVWPTTEELAQAVNDWRAWPVLTPALRRTVQHLDPLDAAALLIDLQEGGGSVYSYRTRQEGEHTTPNAVVAVSAWPLPEALSKESVVQESEDVVAAIMDAGADLVLAKAAQKQTRQAALPLQKKIKKLTELLALQDEEEARLQAMCAARVDAQHIKDNLWQLQSEEHREALTITDAQGQTQRIALDKRYSLYENMERLFKKAKRGQRGLTAIRERRQALQSQLQAAYQEQEACLLGLVPASPAKQQVKQESVSTPKLPNEVQAFVSSDGFVLLRGRNAKGNLTVRRIASQHDLWVHVEGGPGAHVIIRRHHGGHVVPERTLDEAGALAACRSWLQNEPTALINYCEVRHVKAMKNAGAGMVKMDKIWATRKVVVDASLETTLART